MSTLFDLERNDVAGAMAVYRARKADGTLYPSLVSSLLKLQDDPTELLSAIGAEDPDAGKRSVIPQLSR